MDEERTVIDWAPVEPAPGPPHDDDPTEPPPPPPAPEPRRRDLRWLAAAVVGALVGAIVAGLIVGVATDDDEVGDTSAVGARPRQNNTSSIARPADIQGILRRIEPAVVSINTRGFTENDLFGVAPQQGAGTGIVISPDGLVLTNAHVIAGATSIKVRSIDGTIRDGRVLGAVPSADIALVRLEDANGLPTATLGDD